MKISKKFILVLSLLFVICSAVFLSGCGEEVDPYDYFEIRTDSLAAIVIDDVIADEKASVIDGKVYIPYSFVWERINSGFYIDKESEKLMLTLPNEDLSWTKEDGTFVTDDDGRECILADCIGENSDIDLAVYEEPYRVVIRTKWDGLREAAAASDAKLHLNAGEKSDTIKEVLQADPLVFLTEEEGWYLVSTEDGFTGYLKPEEVQVSEQEGLPHTTDERYIFPQKTFDGRIKMIWDYIEIQEDNTYLEAMLEHTDGGINVISPTWFGIADTQGNMTDLGERSYVDRAHAMGMQVWAMLGDYYGDGATSGGILNMESSRKNLLNQLMAAVDAYGLDGVNIDIEVVSEEMAPGYLQFIREAAIACHNRDIFISVDNYPPGYTAYFRRDEQIKMVDYLMVMAYDENNASSEEPGPTASQKFVQEAVENTISEVPADRTVLAVPFFCRSWTVTFGVEGFETQALPMKNAMEFANNHGISLEWNNELCQFYGESEDENGRYMLWLEDGSSLKEKLSLVDQYGLAGAAAWRLGFEEDTIWSTWNEQLNS